MPATSPAPGDATRKLVIVSGSGRSGTSTVAGTLKMLGLTVPQPEVQANETNPRGFFEPRWVVDFHKEWLGRAGVRTLDARPGAAAIAERVGARPRPRAVLDAWLADQFPTPQVVVKDPRTFWFNRLWRDAAATAGAEVTYLTMLRHPAEVIGSRDTHYLRNQTPEARVARETGHLAGWINVVLTNELATRQGPRTFVEYPALIEDWRAVMTTSRDRLGLHLDADPASNEPHAVDDFIDSGLRRVRLTWEDLRVPDHLRDLGEEVWQALLALAADPQDSAATARLDAARTTYREVHDFALALTHDARQSALGKARANARRKEREAVEQERAAAPAPAPSPVPAPALRSLPGRVRRRAARALRRGV